MRFVWEVENRTHFASFAKARAEAFKWVTKVYSSEFEELYKYLLRANFCGIGRKLVDFVKGYPAEPRDLRKIDYEKIVKGLPADEKKKVRKKVSIDPSDGTIWIKLGRTYEFYTNLGKTNQNGNLERYLQLYDRDPDYYDVTPVADVTMWKRLEWGNSAYPLLVLNVLSEKPQTIKRIVKEIPDKYQATIERKAVGRHIELLKMLGYNVKYKEGYYIDPTEPRVKAPCTGYEVLGYVPPDPLFEDEDDYAMDIDEEFLEDDE